MRKICLIVSVTVLAVGSSLGNPVVIDYDRIMRRIRSSSSTQGSTLSTSTGSFAGSSASGAPVYDSGMRTVGITAFGGTDSSYGNGNRYLSTPGKHVVDRPDNKVPESTVECQTCGGEGIVKNWWGGRETCENCKGKGARPICPHCDNTGRVWRWWGGKTDCPVCKAKKQGDRK